MKSFVLRDKGRDLSWHWQFAFVLAFIVTLIASSYVLAWAFITLLGMLAGSARIPFFFIVPWAIWVPVTALVAYGTLAARRWSVFSRNPSALLYRTLEILDATRLEENSQDLQVRRLVNINEEVAIAAGCVPADLYVLQMDYSVNALTLGSSSTAFICITRGALRTLKRDELQAVIAHEYGHVVNDDVMRNTRLLGWLLVMLPDGFRGRRRTPWRMVAWCVGIGAFNLGMAVLLHEASGVAGELAPVFGIVWLASAIVIAALLTGVIVKAVQYHGANITRAAHAGFTRERELEADAISAQLTRDPESLASVLRKISGLRQDSALSFRHSAWVAHMCIASGLFGNESDRFATHPSLEERLRALGHPLTPDERAALSQNAEEAMERYAAEVNAELGVFYAADPMTPETSTSQLQVAAPSVMAPQAPIPALAVAEPFAAVFDITRAVNLLARFPPGIRAALRTADGAWAAAHALICDRDPARATEEQLRLVVLFSKTIGDLGETCRLPLLELASPSLRARVPADRRALAMSLRLQMESDENVSLRAFVFYLLLTKPLQISRPLPSRMSAPRAAAVLLGAAAYAFTKSDVEAQAAFAAGRAIFRQADGMPARERLAISSLERALERLRWLGAERTTVLEALAAIVSHDGFIEIREVEFVRAVALAIDWPMPLISPSE